MPKKLKVLDLPSDLSDHVQAADLLPVQYLHCHLVLGQLVLAHCGREQDDETSNSKHNGENPFQISIPRGTTDKVNKATDERR